MKFRMSCAAIAAFTVLAGPAAAADFGGNCCADLEERIAELEATTARKGNRKVSLEVSGHVNQSILFWDDGAESNAYVITNDSGRTRFRFKGTAKVSSDVKAGYYLEIGIRAPRGDRVEQATDDPAEDAIDVRQSNWFLNSKKFGEIRIGQGNGAAESITEISLANTKDIAKNADVEDYAAGFRLRRAGTSGSGIDFNSGLSNLQWRRLVKDDFIQPGEGSRGAYVYYVSPELAGFEFSAAWGEDDYWDAALRYSGELGDFKLKAGIAYSASTDSTGPGGMDCIVSTNLGNADCEQFGGSLSVMHHPTGLFLTFAAGQFTDNLITNQAISLIPVAGNGARPEDKSSFFSFQSGIETKLNALGKTTFYGEYFKHEGGANDRRVDANDAINPFGAVAGGTRAFLWGTEVVTIGGGVIQKIDAADMSLYLTYRHFEADATFINQNTGELRSTPLEDLDTVMSGAIIKF